MAVQRREGVYSRDMGRGNSREGVGRGAYHVCMEPSELRGGAPRSPGLLHGAGPHLMSARLSVAASTSLTVVPGSRRATAFTRSSGTDSARAKARSWEISKMLSSLREEGRGVSS